jgi:hypothetical protein
MPSRKSAPITDLSPFAADRCRMFVLLAKQAPVAVVVRRGPTKWWHITRWDTQKDHFQSGQWFHGSFYPDRCDLSPDGKLFLYFAGKFRSRDIDRGYNSTWTAVSRPPYLTALALWPIGDTWGGGGVFLDDKTVALVTGPGGTHHPDHPPGPLQVFAHGALAENDPRLTMKPCFEVGWEGPLTPVKPSRDYLPWSKSIGSLVLKRGGAFPFRSPQQFLLCGPKADSVESFKAHWADFDQQGRLVATVGGRILAGEVVRRRLGWRQLAALQDETPVPVAAPAWAQHW